MRDHPLAARAAYAWMRDALRDGPGAAPIAGRAAALSLDGWRRLLALEGCDAQLHHALRGSPLLDEPVGPLLRESGRRALARGLQVLGELPRISDVARRHGLPVLALKGAARLLAGEVPGTRGLSDIDLLVQRGDAGRLHSLLQTELGYAPEAGGRQRAHHLVGLTRGGGLGIEIHTQLVDRPIALDEAIWREATPAARDGRCDFPAGLLIPSVAHLLLHTLEHATRLNWDHRYRLRDVCDVASLFTRDVDGAYVRGYVEADDHRTSMRTLLAAAHALNADVPGACHRRARHAERVGSVRAAASALPARGAVANRVYRYSSVLMDASPPSVARAAWHLVARGARAMRARGVRIAALVATSALPGCRDATVPTAIRPPVVLYAAHVAGGASAIFRADGDTVTRLSLPGNDDAEPRAAMGRVLFTSRRDGNAEVYSADASLGSAARLTNDASVDASPALDPQGATVAFVSDRSGTPRIWLMAIDGSGPQPLATGSATYVPEGSPAWSPTGDRLAFTSLRTNTSQVFVIGRAGGAAVQVTHESTGAFDPAWSADGAVLYTSIAGTPTIMRVGADGSAPAVFAADARGLGEVACSAASTTCVAVIEPLGAASGFALLRNGAVIRSFATGDGDHHHPTILTP